MKSPFKKPVPARAVDDPDRMTKSGRLNVRELKKALKAAEDKNTTKKK